MKNLDLELFEAVKTGRSNMGDTMPVAIYRLFEAGIKEALKKQLGAEACTEIFREAGRIAGERFYHQYLAGKARSMAELMNLLKISFLKMKIGILRVEELKEDEKIILTISEDVDCSGMPVIGTTVCNYDEGFLEAVLSEFSHKDYQAIEIDCWAKGDRVCRFDITPREK